MDHMKILKRAYHITLNFRALWVFGILLSLTTAPLRRGGGSGGGSGSGGSSSLSSTHLASLHLPEISKQSIESMLGLIIFFILLFLLLAIVWTVLRYISETALIRMVDGYESRDEKSSIGQGFRLGWSRPAWRIFLIDLLIGLVALAAFLLLSLIAGAPLLVWLTENETVHVLGSTVSGGLFILVFFLGILVLIALSLLLPFVRRACVLENLGVIDSIRRGWMVLRQRLGDGFMMGVILFVLSLASFIIIFLVAIFLIVAGAILGGLPGLLVGWIFSLVSDGNLPWIAGIFVAAPIFLLVVIAPLVFLGGLIETYKSSAWTLAYREIVALESV